MGDAVRAPSEPESATSAEELARESRRRRTFAIISHPDAGKTTLTEKLLLYGGAIHLAGTRQGAARRPARHLRLDGAGAGARHLGDLQRDAVRVRRLSGQPARHPGPRGLLRGHLPHARRRRQRRHAARQPQGRRGAHPAALRRLQAPPDADLHLRQQVRPGRRGSAQAAERRRSRSRHRLLSGHLAGVSRTAAFVGVYDRRHEAGDPVRAERRPRRAAAPTPQRVHARRRRSSRTIAGRRGRSRSCADDIEPARRGRAPVRADEALLAGELSPVLLRQRAHQLRRRAVPAGVPELAPAARPRASRASGRS